MYGKNKQVPQQILQTCDCLTSYNVIRVCYHIALVLNALKISSFTLEHRFKYGSFYLRRCLRYFPYVRIPMSSTYIRLLFKWRVGHHSPQSLLIESVHSSDKLDLRRWPINLR